MKRGAWVVLFAVLLLRIPFLNQPIQGDDVYYLAGAQHAQIDPLHPTHARYPFLGKIVDMRGHPHPPMNAWLLGLLLAVVGDIREVPFHAAYILLSAIAALSMWRLAERFSRRPLLATLLFLATPAFVVNGNSLESDLPLLAFWMAGTALFVRAVDARSNRLLAASGAACALAAMAAYQAVVLIPILWVYLWLNGRGWRTPWAVTLVPALVLGGWQIFERLSTGAVPGAVLAGFLQSYNFQSMDKKLSNAAALTAHLGWMLFPALVFLAWRRWWPLAAAAGAAGALLLDASPLFWVPFAAGVVVLAAQLRLPVDFLGAWLILFFAAALALFFAGSARYLLPVAAPLALLAVERLHGRPRWLAAGFALQMLLGLGLAAANFQHWEGYRQAAAALRSEARHMRVWVNGEWGLRFYLEAEGGLPLLEGQAVRPGELVVSSALGYPVEFTTGGGRLVPMWEREIRSPLPFRLIALDTRSAYSVASFRPPRLRAFDLARGPIDRVRAFTVAERPPELSHLPMNAPEADSQIVSGIYKLEENRYRWMGGRGIVVLKRPERPAPLEAVVYIPAAAAARVVELWADGRRVAEARYPGPGLYTLVSPPVEAGEGAVTVAITLDKTISTSGDQRELGAILASVGFRR